MRFLFTACVISAATLAFGEEKSPPTPLAVLLAEIVPDDLPARPPFQPARYDLGFRWKKDSEPKLEDLTRFAVERQERLARLWRQAKWTEGGNEADRALLAYAFGEADLSHAIQTANAAGASSQWRLAVLLLAECRFEDAIRILASLADKPKEPLARPALALLARHQSERKTLDAHRLWPLDFDLDGYLRRRAEDPLVRLWIESVQETVKPPSATEETFTFDIGPEEEVYLNLFDDVTVRGSRGPRFSEAADLSRLHLVENEPGFVLTHDDVPAIGRDAASLLLTSEFNGPIRFRLYRFAGRAEWEEITPRKLVARKPDRTWSKTFQPLDANNGGRKEWPVEVDGLSNGYYLVTAEARYSAVLAGVKFCISNTAVYLRADNHGAAIIAINRRTRQPVGQLPLRLVITGQPDMQKVLEDSRPFNEAAFRRGFSGIPKETDSKPDPTMSGELRMAESYAKGVEARRRFPDFRQGRDFQTDERGSARLDLDLSREDYQYRLEIERVDESRDAGPVAHVSLDMTRERTEPDQRRAVVWPAQTIYRPGDTVSFCGITRTVRKGTILGHDQSSPKTVSVEVQNHEGSLWKGTAQVSAAGMFHGSFKVPASAKLGCFRFVVAGHSTPAGYPLAVEEFRLPAFDVKLSVPRKRYGIGERIAGQVRVKYITGKPAAGAQVEVALETGDDSPLTALGETDDHGVFDFSLPPVIRSANYSAHLRATVADLSGQSFTETDHVYVESSPFSLLATTPENSVRAGQTVPLQVRAERWDGHPLAEAQVTATTCDKSTRTDTNGLATLAWTVEKGRDVAVVTVSADGKATHYECRITIESTGDEPAADDPFASAPATPSRKKRTHQKSAIKEAGFQIADWRSPFRLDAGQPIEATLRLTGPADERATVAIITERDRMLSHQVLQLSPGEHKIAIPTRPDWAPSVELTAVLLEPRRCFTRQTSTYLHPVHKLLKLAIETDRDEYRPGQRCTAVVSATDFEGRPVAGAQICLGVIDEAVYLAYGDQLPDLFASLYEYRVHGTVASRFEPLDACVEVVQYPIGPRQAWGYYEVFGPSLCRNGLVGMFGGTKNSGRGWQPPTRSRFENAAHWVADLTTDAEGRARTSFAFPDNITAWRFTARGATPDTRVGDVRLCRNTLLPVQIDMALPRGFRIGDRIEMPIVVHNHTEQRQKVNLVARIGTELPREEKPRELPGRGSFQISLPVHAVDERPIELFAAAAHFDAVRKQLTPGPRFRPIVRRWSGPLETKTVIRPELTAATGGELSLSVRREPGLVGPVQSALDNLVQYPYGCVEQTMSRFMPAVVAGQAMQRAGLENPAADRLPDVIQKGLAALADFQHRDGGWGWWKQDPTNEFMTAYVLEGLGRCAALDVKPDAKMIADGAQFLLRRVRAGRIEGVLPPQSIGEIRLDVYAAHALAICYATDPARFEQSIAELAPVLDSLESDAAKFSPFETALLAGAFHRLGKREAAAKWLRSLPGAAPTATDRRSIHYAAAVLELGAAIEPAQARWRRLACEIVAARTGPDWGDTLTTSAAVRGLSAVLAAPAGKEIPIAVRVDDRKIGILSAAQQNRLNLRLPRIGVVSIEPAEPSEDFILVSVEGRPDGPPQNADSPGAILQTRLFALSPTRREVNPKEGRLPINRATTYELQLDVELKKPISHARLTWPRPCGVEQVRLPSRGEGLVAIESRDEAIHFFIDRWTAGRHRIAFPIRAELAGQFASPPPELEPMYGDSPPTAVSSPSEWTVNGGQSLNSE